MLVVSEAVAEERRILNTFSDPRWEGRDILSAGNSEIFYHDVLRLDELA